MSKILHLSFEQRDEATDIISLNYLKKALRLDQEAEEDELLKHYLEAAISSAEKFIGLVIRQKKIDLTAVLDAYGKVKLPAKPFKHLEEVYIDGLQNNSGARVAELEGPQSSGDFDAKLAARGPAKYAEAELPEHSHRLCDGGESLQISNSLTAPAPSSCKLELIYLAGPKNQAQVSSAIIQGIVQHVCSIYEQPELASIPRASMEYYKFFRNYRL
jgi:hypothetical protein